MMSLDRPASEAPHRWLPQLPTYYEAPLTQYGRPDFAKRDRWLAKMEREAAIESSKSAAKSSRTFKPDPVVQAFVESLPRDPWSSILDILAKRVNPSSFDTWLKPTRFLGVDEKDLVVRVPNNDFGHVLDKWGDAISAIFEELNFPFDGVSLEVVA
jgi:DnaA N-terminal domain